MEIAIVFLIVIATAAAQQIPPDQVRLIELRRAARDEPVRFIGSPTLLPVHQVSILLPSLKKMDNK
jgi:hypothetical protein